MARGGERQNRLRFVGFSLLFVELHPVLDAGLFIQELNPHLGTLVQSTRPGYTGFDALGRTLVKGNNFSRLGTTGYPEAHSAGA